MGIGVEEWRQRIGLFSSPRSSKGLSCSGGLVLPALFKPRLACVACVLAMLLLIGGVEQNPILIEFTLSTLTKSWTCQQN